MIPCPFCGFCDFSTCPNIFFKNNFLQTKKHNELYKTLRDDKITSYHDNPLYYYITLRNYLHKLVAIYGKYNIHEQFLIMPRLIANTENLSIDEINDFLINTKKKLENINKKICGISQLYCVIVGTYEIPLVDTLMKLKDLNLDLVIGLGGGRGFYEYIISKYLGIPVLNYDIWAHKDHYVKSESKSMLEVCNLDISDYNNVLFTFIWPPEFENKIPTKTLINIAEKFKLHSGEIYIMIIMGPKTILYGDGTLMSFMNRKSPYITNNVILDSLKKSWGDPIYSTKSLSQILSMQKHKKITNGIRIHKLGNISKNNKYNMCDIQ